VTGPTPDDERPLEPKDGGDASAMPEPATPPESTAPAPPAKAASPVAPDGPQPDAPTQRTGIISAAPVGWAGPDRPVASTADQPVVAWAPPAAAAAAVPSAVGLGLVIAGTFTRLVAFVIDGLLLFCITFAIGWVVGYYQRGASQTLGIAVAAASIAINAVYYIVLWRSGWHGTVGMRLMRIRVLGAINGATLGLDAAIIRWLALIGIVEAALLVPVATSVIGLVALIWLVLLLVTTATDKLHQGIHDRWAGSVVVQPAPGGSGAAIVGCLVLLAIFLVVPFVLAALLSDAVRDILSQVGNSI
jgi:uncharacterized RDD family membrane protein YckC